jgi:hypothetical protein
LAFLAVRLVADRQFSPISEQVPHGVILGNLLPSIKIIGAEYGNFDNPREG